MMTFFGLVVVGVPSAWLAVSCRRLAVASRTRVLRERALR